jgi:hypothetical protein
VTVCEHGCDLELDHDAERRCMRDCERCPYEPEKRCKERKKVEPKQLRLGELAGR